jgi:hypothetical protein
MLMDSTPSSKAAFGKPDLKRRSCCLQETYLIDRNKYCLRVKGWNKIYQVNGPPKQAGVSILTSDKVDFKLTLIK